MALFNTKKKSNKSERSGVVNSSKTLLANIRFMNVDNPIRTIAITSSVPNEGKTFVTANLGSAIATSGKTCLVVECDLRRRSLSRTLGVHPQRGIYAVMSGECTVQEAAVATKTPNLFFLDAEPRIPNPSDLLSSNRFSNLVDLARNTYDYVVFDTPPVCTFVDAAVLGTKVDAVFLVVRERFTRKADITAASKQLMKSGCNLAGTIMNFCERSSSEYYYYYGYYYSHYDQDSSKKTLGADKTSSKRSERPLYIPKGRPKRDRDRHSTTEVAERTETPEVPEIPKVPDVPARPASTPAEDSMSETSVISVRPDLSTIPEVVQSTSSSSVPEPITSSDLLDLD